MEKVNDATIEEEYINGSRFKKNTLRRENYYAVKKTEDIKNNRLF